MNDPITAARVFLDANVLFSAAIGGRVAALWRIQGVALVSSEYAVAEAWRNLPRICAGPDLEEAEARFETLIANIEVFVQTKPASPLLHTLPPLPDPDDVPILAGAIEAHCHYLITGDRRCFASLFGTVVHGLTILTPGAFLERMRSP